MTCVRFLLQVQIAGHNGKADVDLSIAHPHNCDDGSIVNLGHSFKRGIFTALVEFPPRKCKCVYNLSQTQ